MSYGGGGNYNNNPAMYGGGGSSGDNYYDPQATFHDTQYKGGANYGSEDFNQAIGHAEQEGGGESDKSIFSHAIDFIGKNKHKFSSNEDDEDDIDENQAVNAHQSLYGGGGGDGSGEKYDERSLGAGAAMQALKMFSSGQGSSGSSGTGGHDQNKLIGLAMAQAGKLWDEQNKSGNVKTDKQSAVNSAAKMALKMFTKNQSSSSGGMGGGLGGTGGPGGLSSLAAKFLSK